MFHDRENQTYSEAPSEQAAAHLRFQLSIKDVVTRQIVILVDLLLSLELLLS